MILKQWWLEGLPIISKYSSNYVLSIWGGAAGLGLPAALQYGGENVAV